MKNYIFIMALIALFALIINKVFEIPMPKIDTGKPFTREDGSIVLTGYHHTGDTIIVWFEVTKGSFSDSNDIYRTIPMIVYGNKEKISYQIGRPQEAEYSFRMVSINSISISKDTALFRKKPYKPELIYLNKFVDYTEERSFKVVYEENKNKTKSLDI